MGFRIRTRALHFGFKVFRYIASALGLRIRIWGLGFRVVEKSVKMVEREDTIMLCCDA